MINKTTPSDWLEKPYRGYVMNTRFSDENSLKVMSLIKDIKAKYGRAVYAVPEESLHITLLDWIAPLVDYDGRDKDELFKSIYESYDRAINEALADEHTFDAVFNAIHVSPTTIFISGHDNGEFERMRSKYLDGVKLLPNTKRPPTIIHSSLARFTEELDLAEVEAFMASRTISFRQRIEDFRLVYTYREPMLEFEVLKTYSLAS